MVLACFELREIQNLTETEMKPSFLLKIAGAGLPWWRSG